MDRETAMAVARVYLADCIELSAIPEEEVERLPLYFSGDRHDYYFFYFDGPMETHLELEVHIVWPLLREMGL